MWEEKYKEFLDKRGGVKRNTPISIKKNIFIERFKELGNTNIKLKGEFTGSQNEIECECLLCSSILSIRADSLLKGVGCRLCGPTRLKSTSEFNKQIKDRPFKLLGKYINSKTKIEFQCNICSFIWLAAPTNILSGRGCPSCGKALRKTHEQFSQEVKDITLLTKYISNRSNIKCKCNRCEYVWITKANILNQGHGCPKCSGQVYNTIYILKEKSSGLYKIGITSNINRRKREIRDSELIWYLDSLEHNTVVELEKLIHNKYRKERTTSKISNSGYTEYFKLSLNQIKNIITQIEAMIDYGHLDVD